MKYNLSALALISVVLAMNNPDSSDVSPLEVRDPLLPYSHIGSISADSLDMVESNGIQMKNIEFVLPKPGSSTSPSYIATAKCADLCNNNDHCQSFYVGKWFQKYNKDAGTPEAWARCKLFKNPIQKGLELLPEEGARLYNLKASADNPKKASKHIRGAALNTAARLFSFRLPSKAAHRRNPAFDTAAAEA